MCPVGGHDMSHPATILPPRRPDLVIGRQLDWRCDPDHGRLLCWTALLLDDLGEIVE
jgi:hypothetical protein